METEMQKFKDFQPTQFDSKGLGSDESNENWLVLPLSQNRDSGSLEKSNFETALELLGGESQNPNIEVHRFGHWGPGWFEIIIVNPNHPPTLEIALEIEASLEQYPVLSDEDYSSKQLDDENEAWSNCYESDFQSGIEKIINDFLDNQDIYSKDYFEFFHYSQDGDFHHKLYEVFLQAQSACNIYWEHSESEGASIDLYSILNWLDNQENFFDIISPLIEEEIEGIKKAQDHISKQLLEQTLKFGDEKQISDIRKIEELFETKELLEKL
jgi:hypothetical protein